MKQGLYRDFHENGSIKFEAYYINDDLNGELKHWTEDGILVGEAQTAFGFNHGESKFYNENGVLKEHIFYEHHEDVTEEVLKIVDDINNITQEENIILKLKYGFKLLGESNGT